MSKTLERVQQLIQSGELRISDHGYDELAADGLMARDVVEGIAHALVVEDYLTYPKGPCVLVLQHDTDNQPVHVLWRIPKERERPAVLVTAYRPDPELWQDGFLRRRR